MTTTVTQQAILAVMACLATFTAGLIFIRIAPRLGFLDIPTQRKVHQNPTPRTGGLAMVTGGLAVFLIALLLGWNRTELPWQTWLAGGGFITIGALDDRFSYRPSRKFFFLLALSALAAWPWIIVLKTSGLHWLPSTWVNSSLFLPCSTILLTLWFMAVPNAVNIEDAINGYMGCYTLAVAGLAVWLGVGSPIVVGALLGFLVLNWPHGKQFMGDAGSFGCGFFIAESVMRSGGSTNPIFAMLLTAPISFDVAMGILRRVRLGQSLFHADRSTLPHRILILVGGYHFLATPMLMANVIIFIFLALNPSIWNIFYIIAFIGFLFWTNRKELFSRCCPPTAHRTSSLNRSVRD